MTEKIELYKSDAITNIDEDQLGRKPFIEVVTLYLCNYKGRNSDVYITVEGY